MWRIVAAFRFLVGLTLVAAGAALAGPTIATLVREVARHQQAASAVATPPGAAGAMQAPASAPPAEPPLATQTPVEWPAVEAVGQGPALPLDPHYQPPQPPAPLPPVAADLAGFAPEVSAAYRSTFAAPPPPLLDAHRPPPLAAGWTAHEVAPPTPVAEMPAAVVPQSYVIRDGDDLTGIATRFYGHASAATAIWTANRDALPDPNVLPIGAAIRLPPAWTVQTAWSGDPRAIEPRAAGDAAAMPAAAPAAATTAQPVGWLTGGGRAPAASPAPAAPQRPASVRVAPGETLASLARRFYGDERMAARIWEINRDRLRSPELVVAGMELRLP